jgi:hypothetical protein
MYRFRVPFKRQGTKVTNMGNYGNFGFFSFRVLDQLLGKTRRTLKVLKSGVMQNNSIVNSQRTIYLNGEVNVYLVYKIEPTLMTSDDDALLPILLLAESKMSIPLLKKFTWKMLTCLHFRIALHGFVQRLFLKPSQYILNDDN